MGRSVPNCELSAGRYLSKAFIRGIGQAIPGRLTSLRPLRVEGSFLNPGPLHTLLTLGHIAMPAHLRTRPVRAGWYITSKQRSECVAAFVADNLHQSFSGYENTMYQSE